MKLNITKALQGLKSVISQAQEKVADFKNKASASMEPLARKFTDLNTEETHDGFNRMRAGMSDLSDRLTDTMAKRLIEKTPTVDADSLESIPDHPTPPPTSSSGGGMGPGAGT